MWKDHREQIASARHRWMAPGTGPVPGRRIAFATVAAAGVTAVVITALGPTSGSPAPVVPTDVVVPAPQAPPAGQIPGQYVVGPGRALAE